MANEKKIVIGVNIDEASILLIEDATLQLVDPVSNIVLSQRRIPNLKSLHVVTSYAVGNFDDHLLVFNLLNILQEPLYIQLNKGSTFSTTNNTILITNTDNSCYEIPLEDQQASLKDFTLHKRSEVDGEFIDIFKAGNTSEEIFVSLILKSIAIRTEKNAVLVTKIINECSVCNVRLKLSLLEHLNAMFPDIVRSSLYNFQTFCLCFPTASHPKLLFLPDELFKLSSDCLCVCDINSFMTIWRRTKFDLDQSQLSFLLKRLQQHIDDVETCSRILTDNQILIAISSSMESILVVMDWLTNYLQEFEYTAEWPENVLALIDKVLPQITLDLSEKIRRPLEVAERLVNGKHLEVTKIYNSFISFRSNLQDIAYLHKHFFIRISLNRYLSSKPELWIHQLISSTSDLDRLHSFFENEFEEFAKSCHLVLDEVISSFLQGSRSLSKMNSNKLILLLSKIRNVNLKSETILAIVEKMKWEEDITTYVMTNLSYQYKYDIECAMKKCKLKSIIRKHEIVNYNCDITKPTATSWVRYILQKCDCPLVDRINDALEIGAILKYLDITEYFIFYTLLKNNLKSVGPFQELLTIIRQDYHSDDQVISALKDLIKFVQYRVYHTNSTVSDDELDCLQLTLKCVKHIGICVETNGKIINAIHREKKETMNNSTDGIIVVDNVRHLSDYSYLDNKLEKIVKEVTEENFDVTSTILSLQQLIALKLSNVDVVKVTGVLKLVFAHGQRMKSRDTLNLLKCAVELFTTYTTDVVDNIETILMIAKYLCFVEHVTDDTGNLSKLFVEEGLEIDPNTKLHLLKYLTSTTYNETETLVEDIFNHGHILLSISLFQHTLSHNTLHDQQSDIDTISLKMEECTYDLCEKILRCTSDDGYFALYALHLLATNVVIDIVQVLRRAIPEAMVFITRVLECYLELGNEAEYLVYLKKQRSVTKWSEFLMENGIVFDVAVLKKCVKDEEYEVQARELLLLFIRSDDIEMETIISYREEMYPQHLVEHLCEDILSAIIPCGSWNRTYCEKLNYALKHSAQPPNLHTLITQIDEYNYEGIEYILHKMRETGNTNKMYRKYSTILGILSNYTRNCESPRLPFHAIYQKAVTGSAWEMLKTEVGENVLDLVDICRVLKLDPQYFYIYAIKNVAVKYKNKDVNALMSFCTELLEYVESHTQSYQMAQWLSCQVVDDSYKDVLLQVCLKVLAEQLQEENTEENKTMSSQFRFQYNLFRSCMYLKKYSLEIPGEITKSFVLIQEVYSRYHHNKHISTIINGIVDIWVEQDYPLDISGIQRRLVKTWLLHDRTTEDIIDINFKKAVVVLHNFSEGSITSSLLEMVYYKSRVDITPTSQIRFILALLMTVSRSTIEEHVPLSDITQHLCTLVFTTQLPPNMQFTVTMFRKCDKLNLVQSIIGRYGARYLSLCLDICITYKLDTDEIWYMLLDTAQSDPNILYEVLQHSPSHLTVSRYWDTIVAEETLVDSLKEKVIMCRGVIPTEIFLNIIGA